MTAMSARTRWNKKSKLDLSASAWKTYACNGDRSDEKNQQHRCCQRVKEEDNSLGVLTIPSVLGMTRVGLRPIQFLGQLSLEFSLYFETAAIRLRLSNFKADVRAFLPVPALPL